jgi:hypothetical protein
MISVSVCCAKSFSDGCGLTDIRKAYADLSAAPRVISRRHAGVPRLPLGQRPVADRYEAGLTALSARGLYDEAAILIVSRSIIEGWFG